jgi:hypothetical protein
MVCRLLNFGKKIEAFFLESSEIPDKSLEYFQRLMKDFRARCEKSILGLKPSVMWGELSKSNYEMGEMR